jgi:bifunctional UDP-N-acetylglucosamine pyrophosphorylase/glucosamine-1-phosphate N-acetyltransferase
MKSATPKVLHSISGRTLVGHVLHAVSGLSAKQVRVVVGAGREKVEAHIAEIAPHAVTVFQEKRGGTGHATQLALEGLKPAGTILILAGDTPMLTGTSLTQLLEHHHAGGFTASVMTALHPDPTGYGRIIRADDDSLARIVEERDADEMEREIIEVNSGVYAFDAAKLAGAIGKLKSSNSQGELYLTDVIEILRNEGGTIAPVLIEDFIEILGVNDRVQLAESAALLRDRINEDLMREGVTIVDPLSTWVDSTAKIERDVIVMPGTAITGTTTVASGAVVGPRSTLHNCTVGESARVL